MTVEISRNAVKAHLMASFQTVHRYRADMLEVLEPSGNQPTKRLGPALVGLQEHLVGEVKWLRAIAPHVDRGWLSVLTGDSRRAFLKRYGSEVVGLMRALHAAVQAGPVTETYGRVQHAAGWRPVGVGILRLLALEEEARGL